MVLCRRVVVRSLGEGSRRATAGSMARRLRVRRVALRGGGSSRSGQVRLALRRVGVVGGNGSWVVSQY